MSDHSRLLYKIVRAYTSTSMDRDDLFQEVAIQVWRSIPAFRRECAVTTWLYRIALNTSIRWVTKLRRRPAAESIADHHFVLAEISDDDQRLQWLYSEITKLDEIDRSIMLLVLDGLSYKEMSVILGITESNVGVKINRIKKYLSQQSKNSEAYGV